MTELTFNTSKFGSTAEALQNTHVVVDLHGTLKKPPTGGDVRCIREQLTDELAGTLRDMRLNQLELMVNASIAVHRDLVPTSKYPPVETARMKEFVNSSLRYTPRFDQQKALFDIAHGLGVRCTLVSAMKSDDGDDKYIWAWVGLGKAQEALAPDLQMLLRLGPNPLVSKLAGAAYIKKRFDEPPDERAGKPERMVFVADDDINYARILSKLLRVPVLVPIEPWQEPTYPRLEVPASLQELPEEVYLGAGLPQLNEFMVAYLEGRDYRNFGAYRVLRGISTGSRLPISLDDFRAQTPPNYSKLIC